MLETIQEKRRFTICQVCENGGLDLHPTNCSRCKKKYPYALLKAVCAPFTYAASIQGLGVVEFESARICGDWVMLFPGNHDGIEAEFKGLIYPFPRGIEVLLTNILWVADAPRGS